MEGARAADAYGLLPDHDSQQSDAEQAYTQAWLTGTETWVRLPKDQWPQAWIDSGLRDPVCPLILSLYGHPDAGGYWERHCDKHLIAVGFKPIREWRSCYFHDELKLFLVVYVDDFKLAGPREHLQKGWDLLQEPSELVPGEST